MEYPGIYGRNPVSYDYRRLGLALLLRRNFKGSGVFKFVLFSPWITPTVAISIVWTWIFREDGGLANQVLGLFGLPALKWISSSDTAMLSVIIVTVWKSLGYAMIFYLSALEKVPEELYEASALDGASPGGVPGYDASGNFTHHIFPDDYYHG